MKCLFEMHVKLYNEIKIFHTVGTTSKYNSKIVEKGKIDTLTTQKHNLFILFSWCRYFNNSYTDVSFYNFFSFPSFYLNRSIKCLHKKQYLCLADLDVVEMDVCRLRTYIIDLYSYFWCKMK